MKNEHKNGPNPETNCNVEMPIKLDKARHKLSKYG